MSKADDPERLLAEALRAQAAQTPLPPTQGDATAELVTVRIQQNQDVKTDRFSPLDNVLGPMDEGPGFGLLSGTEVGTLAGGADWQAETQQPPAETESSPPRTQTRLNAWLIMLIVVLLGLAAGVVIGLLSIT